MRKNKDIKVLRKICIQILGFTGPQKYKSVQMYKYIHVSVQYTTTRIRMNLLNSLTTNRLFAIKHTFKMYDYLQLIQRLCILVAYSQIQSFLH